MKIINGKGLERKPHASDIELVKNRKNNNSSKELKNFTFVLKPWGFEYLCYRDTYFDIWELCINKLSSTSSHLHTKKDVLILVLEGTITLTLTQQIETITTGDIRVVKRKALHRITNPTNDTARILEIESPPDRHDLIRVEDTYGRTGMVYATSNTIKQNIKNITPNHFFSNVIVENEYYLFFNLLPFLKNKLGQKSSQKVHGIILKKNTSNLSTLEKQIQLLQAKAFFVVSGTVHISVKNTRIKIIKRGECFFITNISKFIWVEKNSKLLFWN